MSLFIYINQKERARGNIRIQQVLSSLYLSGVGIFLKDDLLKTDMGIVNIRPFKGSYWAIYATKNYFGTYGCAPPKKFSNFILKRNGYCLYSNYKVQGLTSKKIVTAQVIVIF